MNIAHRGARSLAPENTLAAARKALECGADMWELDVQVSADGELIVIHDDTLERTSNASAVYADRWPWPVHRFTLDELRSLDFGTWFVRRDPFGTIAAGEVSAAELGAFAGEVVPTLREALLFTKHHGWRVNVEIKDLSRIGEGRNMVEQVVGMVEDLGMQSNVLLSSFNHRYLRQIRAMTSHIATGALVTAPVRDPVELLRRLGAQAYHPASVKPQIVSHVKRSGLGVNVWTVNSGSRMRRLIQAGVTGIFTDFPHLLKAVLEAVP